MKHLNYWMGTLVAAALLAFGCSASEDDTDTPPTETGGTNGTGTGGAAGGTTGTGGIDTSTAASLPAVLDDIGFTPSGHMGDGQVAGTITSEPNEELDSDTTCGGNRPSGAEGYCHSFVFDPPATSEGWGGVFWQYPANNWGAFDGRAIDAGATQVSFYARADVAGIIVKFQAGMFDSASGTGADGWSVESFETLTTDWTQYTLDLSGETYDDVVGAFAWVIETETQTVAGPWVIYIDDLKWE